MEGGYPILRHSQPGPLGILWINMFEMVTITKTESNPRSENTKHWRETHVKTVVKTTRAAAATNHHPPIHPLTQPTPQPQPQQQRQQQQQQPQPTTNNQPPTINHQPSATNNQRSATNNKQQTTKTTTTTTTFEETVSCSPTSKSHWIALRDVRKRSRVQVALKMMPLAFINRRANLLSLHIIDHYQTILDHWPEWLSCSILALAYSIMS